MKTTYPGKSKTKEGEVVKNKMTNCKACGEEIAKSAKSCPKCGAKNKKPIFKKWWLWLIVIVLAFAACSGGGGSVEDPGSTQEGASVNEPADNENTEQEDANVSAEFKNALKKAETYADMMHMSKAAIYNQLISEYGEQFPEDAAQYAMDNLEADWNANALAKAENYSESMHMSKAAIYDQLVSEYGEQFTAEEAQYAIDNIEANWNANALAKAKTYQESMSMSKNAIYDQLVSDYGEKFTAEQAQYAVDNLE